MAWTSRERVIAAIEHREPDRVPVDINPVPDFYLKLKDYVGLEIEEKVKSAELKQEFGDRLTFHGGVDEQNVLPFGSKEDVAGEVRRCIRAFAPGGGYILAPSHYVQGDTPPANMVAMCRAAHRYGQYS